MTSITQTQQDQQQQAASGLTDRGSSSTSNDSSSGKKRTIKQHEADHDELYSMLMVLHVYAKDACLDKHGPVDKHVKRTVAPLGEMLLLISMLLPSSIVSGQMLLSKRCFSR